MNRITSFQKRLLDSLVCERMSTNEANLRLVDGFYNYRNEALANVILNEAFEEDEKGAIAYYVVKHKESGKVLFYFSLKSGMLFDQYLDDKKYKALNEWYKKIEQKSSDAFLSPEEKALYDSLKEKIRSHKGLTKVELEQLSQRNLNVFDDLAVETNLNITHVLKTYSGVELVHFCSNNDADDVWESFHLPRSRGVVVFWRFIVPIILQLKEIVGCEYLFLFAADDSNDQTLVEYYRNRLYFDDNQERAVAKPVYDFTCKFMYQELAPLKDRQIEFFENFNTIEE